jgi:hypothetical protein
MRTARLPHRCPHTEANGARATSELHDRRGREHGRPGPGDAAGLVVVTSNLMHSGAPSSAGVSREDASTAIVGRQAGHRYDLLGTSTLENPYPLYNELHSAAPVYRDRRFFGCILTRYDDVVAV